MNNHSEVVMNNRRSVVNILGWLFGIAVLAAGFINIFWGNDQGFGLFLVLLSLVYFPPVNVILDQKLGFAIPLIVKILLGLFIVWASLGVGELFNKIDLMMMN